MNQRDVVLLLIMSGGILGLAERLSRESVNQGGRAGGVGTPPQVEVSSPVRDRFSRIAGEEYGGGTGSRVGAEDLVAFMPIPDLPLESTSLNFLHEQEDDALRSSAARTAWKIWEDVVLRENPREIGLIAAALGDKLRVEPDQSVLVAIRERMRDASSTLDERLALVDVLRYAATPSAVNILLDYLAALQNDEQELNEQGEGPYLALRVREAIELATHTPSNDEPNWSVSSSLEGAWPVLLEHGQYDDLSMVADGLAYLGTDSGTKTLLDTAAQEVPEDSAPAIARDAISRLTSTDAVPALGAALMLGGHSADFDDAILKGLVSIGKPDAAMALVDYLRSVVELPEHQQNLLVDAFASHPVSDSTRRVLSDAFSDGSVVDPGGMAVLESALGIQR